MIKLSRTQVSLFCKKRPQRFIRRVIAQSLILAQWMRSRQNILPIPIMVTTVTMTTARMTTMIMTT